MPNYCDYTLIAAGSIDDLEYFHKCLTYDYSYDAKNNQYPDHEHFCRIFQSEIDHEGSIQIDDKHDYYMKIDGDCAWSVRACMFDGIITYCHDFKERYGDNSKAIDILSLSKKHNLIIEITSIEPGNDFTEYYYIKDGVLVEEKSRALTWAYIDNEGNELAEDDIYGLEGGVDYDCTYIGYNLEHFKRGEYGFIEFKE